MDTENILTIQPTVPGDLIRINKMVNDVILHHNYNLSLTAKTVEERMAWYEAHTNHPLYFALTALVDGQVAGMGAISPFRDGGGYNRTGELSIYVHKDFRGRLIASRLMEAIEDKARRRGFHVIVSGITADNDISITLHEKHGYEQYGYLPEVGYKNGGYIDVLFMMKYL